MTPPTLPGEVWRGDVDGPVCVTVTDGAAEAWWWDDAAEDVDGGPEWSRANVMESSILKAWALSLRADAQRTAEQMREACANLVAFLGARPSMVAAVRALPIPAPTSPPLCSCPDRIAAGTPYPDHRGRWGIDMHAARAWAEARDYDVTQDSEGNDYPMWCEVRGCPWCARPLPDEAASLHVPGCARREAEGAGHPGACREQAAADDRGKP